MSMTDTAEEKAGFEELKARLDEIVEAVSDEGISLDDALALYEEAVSIGLAACDASELVASPVQDDHAEAVTAADGTADVLLQATRADIDPGHGPDQSNVAEEYDAPGTVETTDS